MNRLGSISISFFSLLSILDRYLRMNLLVSKFFADLDIDDSDLAQGANFTVSDKLFPNNAVPTFRTPKIQK